MEEGHASGMNEAVSSEESGSDIEDENLVHHEDDTDVEDLFPIPDEEELEEALAEDKAAKIREARRKDAKARALKTRQVKQRAAAGTNDDAIVLSDSCSEDHRELDDPSDDDGAELESKIAVRTRKSRAKPIKKRVYYDESKSNAHEQLELELCFSDVNQFRRALQIYHIMYRRDYTLLRNIPHRVIACCRSDGTCSFMIVSSQIKGEHTHVIRQIVMPHTCGTTTDSSRINNTWFAKRYEDEIRSDPNMNVTALMDVVMRDYGVDISKHMAYISSKE